MNALAELTPALHPDKCFVAPYAMPKPDTRPILEVLAASRAHALSRVPAKKHADFSATLAAGKFIEPEERDILLTLEKKCQELIALGAANSNQAVKSRFANEQEAAARGELNAKQISKSSGSLAAALDTARHERKLIEESLRRILVERIIPMVVVIGERVLRAVESEAETAMKSYRALWAKYDIDIEECELERALRDAVAHVRWLVDTGFSGMSGDVTPSSALAKLGLNL